VDLRKYNIAFRVNEDIWTISFISKEWHNTGGNTKNIIIREFHKWQKFIPVILLVIIIYIEVLLECLVCEFSLFIIFRIVVSQTSFSSYFHNQWTNFHKPSCIGKLQMKAICTYVGHIKATTNNWDIKSSVTEKSLFANISWTAGQICTIKLVLESTHQTVSNYIWYIS